MGDDHTDITPPVRLRDCQVDAALLETRDTGFGPEAELPPGHLPGQRRHPQHRAITGIVRPAGPALKQDGVKIDVPVGAGAIEVPDCEVCPQIDTAVTLAM